jgi:type II secretory pathway pseudopilin PulG
MKNAANNGQKGFTLVEVTIILLVLVILSTILLPNLGGCNRLARFARVKEDLGALCSSMQRYVVDTGENWVLSYLEAFAEPTDITASDVQFRVDTFANHLIHNTPFGNGTAGHRLPADMINGASSAGIAAGLLFDPISGQGFNSMFAWRGPYISDRVDADPWGNRYMANVFAMHVPADATSDGFGAAVVCYSAGPDETIDTDFNQPGGWFTGDDDFVALSTAAGGR